MFLLSQKKQQGTPGLSILNTHSEYANYYDTTPKIISYAEGGRAEGLGAFRFIFKLSLVRLTTPSPLGSHVLFSKTL